MRASKTRTQHEVLLSMLADDADVQRALVQMRGWAEKLAAAEIAAEQEAEAEDHEAWVRAVPAAWEADKHRSLGTAVLVLVILCGVALVALRLR
ncbi:hypothetical protein [Sorangium cellulosum]|uniref:Uncharacterized protein n=1 Tax=Sorangium cellulosum So0157-2 TaxID=1254432 RepID=S4XUB5_SORCE|nr:hypothetical protein [Sorangium cellulosum]AGP35450.1 hypothetical protein SCE1572_13490 [Sorangium cellulosum So0157-2]